MTTKTIMLLPMLAIIASLVMMPSVFADEHEQGIRSQIDHLTAEIKDLIGHNKTIAVDINAVNRLNGDLKESITLTEDAIESLKNRNSLTETKLAMLQDKADFNGRWYSLDITKSVLLLELIEDNRLEIKLLINDINRYADNINKNGDMLTAANALIETNVNKISQCQSDIGVLLTSLSSGDSTESSSGTIPTDDDTSSGNLTTP